MIRKILIPLIGLSLFLSFSAEAGNRHGKHHKKQNKHHHGRDYRHQDRHYGSRHKRHHGCRHPSHYRYGEYRQGYMGPRFEINLGYGYAGNGAVIYVPSHPQAVIRY